LFQSYLHVAQDGLPFTDREMFLSFESLDVTNAPSLHVFLMDSHHDTSVRSILEDDSISSTSKAHICSCLGKGAGLWLIAKPSIAHSTFTLMLCSCLNLTFDI
jgi:hypothetical protein